MRRILFFKKSLYYEQGDKSGRALARALKESQSSNNVHGIKDHKGQLLHNPKDIADTFSNFYSKLYNIPTQNRPTDITPDRDRAIKDYLYNSNLPTLQPDHISSLEEDITVDEVNAAIKALKPGKCPGPDGFTAQYYKLNADLLAQHLTDALNTLKDNHTPSKDFLLAHISVIPKPDKDPCLCSNYRPISLLNIDLKLLAKILAERLRPFLEHIIGPEQVGFMPGREAKDNIIKSLNLIHGACCCPLTQRRPLIGWLGIFSSPPANI